jgi:hypothetical protein
MHEIIFNSFPYLCVPLNINISQFSQVLHETWDKMLSKEWTLIPSKSRKSFNDVLKGIFEASNVFAKTDYVKHDYLIKY